MKCKANTSAAKVMPKDFDELKEQFIQVIRTIVEFVEVPLNLVINWDQTGIQYVPVLNWTFEAKGSKRVEICGVDEKRQITALLAGELTGTFLPPQLIYVENFCLPPSISFS